MNIKKLIIIFLSLAVFLIFADSTKAAVLKGLVDTTGRITGYAGATYYNADSWQDMKDTYTAVTPNSASNRTVFFNITADVQGSPVLNTGNVLINNKSLTINGNNKTLYLDNNRNYSDAQSISGSDRTARAFGSNGTISPWTILTIKNANIINNITSGIFQLKGPAAAATTIYQDVTVSNGANQGAQPIRNDVGKILFYGNNTFNILQNQNFDDISNTGADNQGEWIQGGMWTQVVNGRTTLNQSWGLDQPFYIYYTNKGSTLQVDKGGSLVMNLNKTYTLYYDDGNTQGPLDWNIDGNFLINGTANTATNYSGGWFMWLNTLNAWNLNVGKDATFKASTGGMINIGGRVGTDGFMGGPVNWRFNNGSKILLNNLANLNLITGSNPPGSGITLNNPDTVTLNTVGNSVFSPLVTNFPVHINGSGLRTHASSTSHTFDRSYDLTVPNKKMLAPNDIWYRPNIGTITGLGLPLPTSNLRPKNYSIPDLKAISSSKYLSWYQPRGYWLNIGQGPLGMDKSFDISLDSTAANGTPRDGSWSSLIHGSGIQILSVGDDRQKPSVQVSVKMLQNIYPKGLQFYWTHPESGASVQLKQNNALKIATITDDAILSSWIKMEGAGLKYTMIFANNRGLGVKANNSLLVQKNTNAAIFQYTVANGPS